MSYMKNLYTEILEDAINCIEQGLTFLTFASRAEYVNMKVGDMLDIWRDAENLLEG